MSSDKGEYKNNYEEEKSMKLKLKNQCLISLFILSSFIGLVNACVPPHPSYKLNLKVTYNNALVAGALVFIFNQNEITPIQHAYTDSWGETQFSLGPNKYKIVIVWDKTYTIKENISVPFAGAYMTIEIESNIVEMVYNKCYNWVLWTLGILCISLIVGTFLIAYGLKISWKKAIGYSVLVNVPSVVIGVLLYLIL